MTGVACLDIGSTFTKGVLVDVGTGSVLGQAGTPTTSGTDVLDGVAAVQGELGAAADVMVCSSAGGGLRLAVVGYERAVTAEAGRRVALSAGARVVSVSSGPLDEAAAAAVRDSRPDVLLLAGGTDGGNAEVLLHNATVLARSGPRCPVVVAGNASAAPAAARLLAAGGLVAAQAANVLPEIGRLDPTPAREAIRRVFLEHVIAGKGLTQRPADLRAMVRAATPDAVLAGVEVLGRAGDVLVVDVGGATTDVYSVVDVEALEPEDAGDVAGTPAASRTVEGDLGVRWGAPGVVEAAVAERLLEKPEAARLEPLARARHDDPAWLAESAAERADDVTLARLAVTVALRRHARDGRDLRRVALVVGSGGVLRHASPAERDAVLAPAREDVAGGWRLPERARVVTDERSVLAAAGLLASGHAAAAAALCRTLAAS